MTDLLVSFPGDGIHVTSQTDEGDTALQALLYEAAECNGFARRTESKAFEILTNGAGVKWLSYFVGLEIRTARSDA